MISVDAALQHLFALVSPLDAEDVPLSEAAGRVLSQPVAATRDQPPFRTSVMDGYAVRTADVSPGAALTVTGEAAAGHATGASVSPGEAIRIFTGAPVPDGADRVLIQEDASRKGDTITVGDTPDPGPYIRAAGADFRVGDTISAPRRLSPSDVVLAAAMNHATLPCTRKPQVALIATGDELVMPGEIPRDDQIIASNTFGLAAMLEAHGAIPRRLPIARDTPESLETAFDQARGADLVVTIGGASVGDHDLVQGVAKARGMEPAFYKVAIPRRLPIARDTPESLETAFDLARGADLILTIGGASVGDHDLVQGVAKTRGMEPAFYKVAMRPGKPLMAGRIDGVPMIGLPGNPVSAMVCGMVFAIPALRVMQGLPAAPAPRLTATLATDLGQNGPREHYMRARLEGGTLRPFERQDSGLMGILADANALLVRAPHAEPVPSGTEVEYLPL